MREKPLNQSWKDFCSELRSRNRIWEATGTHIKSMELQSSSNFNGKAVNIILNREADRDTWALSFAPPYEMNGGCAMELVLHSASK